MNDVKINKIELLETIKSNLKNHIEEYIDAYSAYLQKCKTWLDKVSIGLDKRILETDQILPPDIAYFLSNNYSYKGWSNDITYRPMLGAEINFAENLVDNDIFNFKDIFLKSDLVAPENYISDYIRAIAMLEMSVDDVISLSQIQFDQYVMDKWVWKDSFKAINATYSSTKKI